MGTWGQQAADKYCRLSADLAKTWEEYTVTMVPVVIGALGLLLLLPPTVLAVKASEPHLHRYPKLQATSTSAATSSDCPPRETKRKRIDTEIN